MIIGCLIVNLDATITVVSHLLQIVSIILDALWFIFKHNKKNQSIEAFDDYSARFGPKLPDNGFKVIRKFDFIWFKI